jgi:hypothetical protein
MKLSEQTIEILKNYATLNPALQFRKGSVLTTITPTKTVFASTRVVESFPSDFIIGDLNAFLSKLTLYKDAELEFEPEQITIRSADGRRKDTIRGKVAKVVTLPDPNKKISLDNPDHTFELSQEDLQWQRKSAGISGSIHMIIRGDGKKVYLQSLDVTNDSSDVSSTEIGTTTDTFRYVIKLENWKMLDGAYRVKLTKGLSKFEHKDRPVEYYIAIESKLSEF